MTLLRWLIITILALALLETAAFTAIAAAMGPGPALLFMAMLSACGVLVIRYGGAAHIAHLRSAIGNNRLGMPDSGNTGGRILAAGILLLAPGFITGALGIVVLATALPRAMGFGRSRSFAANDNVVDLAREDWRHVDGTNETGQRDRIGKNPD